MSYEPIKMVKVIKNGKTYHNFYVLGVLVNPQQKGQYMKLYYLVSQYMRDHNIEMVTIEKNDEVKEDTKNATKK